MNGIEVVFDSNALIYFIEGKSYMHPFLNRQIGFSVISEMELLSLSSLSIQEVDVIKSFLNSCITLSLTDRIKDMAISLRRKYRVKLPDAIIAGTALSMGLPLVTADKGFVKISELDLWLINPII